MRFFVVSVVAHMGIVGMMGYYGGFQIMEHGGKLYLNMWFVSSDMLWTFANTILYKSILGGFVGAVVLDYYQRKASLKMDCRACEGDCIIGAV